MKLYARDIIEKFKEPHIPEYAYYRLLSRVDFSVFKDILSVRKDCPMKSYNGVQENGDILLVEEPYAELYEHYIKAQLHLMDEEYGKYNNEITLYNALYSEYKNAYFSEHGQLDDAEIKVF